MSEFECRNGHLMPSGKFKCPECGAPLYKMDGFTAKQHKMMEADDYDDREEDDREDFEDGEEEV